jgi:hypothetical protein
MRLAAVCAIYGGYDLIPPVPEGVDDAVLVTDVPVRSGWRNIVEPSVAHPRLAAKRPKARPDLYTDCDASLWMDGSIHVRDGAFVELVQALLAEHELVLTDHPEDRDCLYQEAAHCRDWPKYRSEPLEDQIEHYRELGMPEHFGLWAAGSIARRHTDRMREFGDAWLSEMQRWTIQDQVSLPFVLWRDEIAFGTFGVDQLENPYFDLLPHAEELRNHRRIVLELERRLIDAEGRAENAATLLDNLRNEHERLQARKAVRAALALAGLTKPLFLGRDDPASRAPN